MERDELGRTVLHVAAQRNNPRIIMAAMQRVPLLARASFANAQTESDAGSSGRRTALHEAALRGNAKVIMCLLIHGARFDIRDGHGRTPLDIWERMRYPAGKLRAALSLLGL